MKLAGLAVALVLVVGCAETRGSTHPPPAIAADSASTTQATVSPAAPAAPPAPPTTSAGTRDRAYTMADLEALDHQRAYLELVQHLGDIPPTSRDAAWEALAVRASIGLLDASTREQDPVTALITADDLIWVYPVLMTSRVFTQKRAEVGLKGFTQCYQLSYGGSRCTESFLRFIERDPTNTELAMNAGRLVIRNQFPYVAVRFFNVAVAGKKKPKECADPELKRAVAAAEDALLKDDPTLITAQGIRAICK